MIIICCDMSCVLSVLFGACIGSGGHRLVLVGISTDKRR